ncbi:hypothetical protein COT87_02280 [Candidatus Collierbacteria bacterium CG10_big_fil_rev_8_21_14_0_10_44_9]|uniref:Uncharacterized protein n=1 Tax=Candidatus Collierbacteria bacterium CG10_big_fil_rev_8_21_14_0_10_44_9 TaxID=1974535 RepID=A0A2H0VIJ7_9BACT|nr:MAG: hypothetical protein COT87_02280 [Candidatus Collierbacteria bacterium CG10_big_fil_rev_8_21_14_0_10_44_9]
MVFCFLKSLIEGSGFKSQFPKGKTFKSGTLWFFPIRDGDTLRALAISNGGAQRGKEQPPPLSR